jgi:hypothetical protein
MSTTIQKNESETHRRKQISHLINEEATKRNTTEEIKSARNR